MEDESEEPEEGELDKHAPGYFKELWRDKAGDIHRLNGPAFTLINGELGWGSHGKYHRDDGPARIWPSTGLEEWWKNGERYEPSAHDLILWKMKKKE